MHPYPPQHSEAVSEILQSKIIERVMNLHPDLIGENTALRKLKDLAISLALSGTHDNLLLFVTHAITPETQLILFDAMYFKESAVYGKIKALHSLLSEAKPIILQPQNTLF